ncbi:hypothetical protein M427DRAFT_34413 [Gonapodya prolifera JEL478]|uniref:Uncharacterized protein n=1 Tax=Gonapodya prolifera (strain JEL478) TaxID=1344416 RepID=A0A139A850_GONPJ|nr:hypothetical protein M427DRAFT_34413 [Gonapodya prolifera JEL478]|eukprot:KXS12991.1 hypothetical protein M427DRAFT_34413 [Gonapodya prolifera JEL478]
MLPVLMMSGAKGGWPQHLARELTHAPRTPVQSHIRKGDLPVDTNGIYLLLKDPQGTSALSNQLDAKRSGITTGMDFDSPTSSTRGSETPTCADPTGSSTNPDTDPTTTAWNDHPDGTNDGEENSDNCAYTYGAAYLDFLGYWYNNEWNGRKFLIQQNWDPEKQLCGGASAWLAAPGLMIDVFSSHAFAKVGTKIPSRAKMPHFLAEPKSPPYH